MGLTSHNWGYAMSSNDTNQGSNKQDNDGIFIISMSEWEKLFHFAMLQKTDSEAIRVMTAYLVLVRGSGVDNVTTSWSSQSIRTYTGISPEPSKRAINLLAEFGFIKIVKEGRKPSYKITLSKKKSKNDNSDILFIPNNIVTGAADEVPPLKRLVQYQDPYVLYLFIRLYGFQDKYLDVVNPDIASSVINPDDKEAIEIHNESNLLKVWALDKYPTMTGKFKTDFYDFAQHNNADYPFFDKSKQHGSPFIFLDALQSLNLLHSVAYVCNGDQASSADELEYICDANSDLQATYIKVITELADEKELGLSDRLDKYPCHAVLPANYRKVHFQLFYQLKYRTKLGAAPSRHADNAIFDKNMLDCFRKVKGVSVG